MLYKLLLLLLIQPSIISTVYFLRLAVPIRKPNQYAMVTLSMIETMWIVNNMLLPVRSAFLEVIVYPLIFLTLFFYTERQQWFRAFLAQGVLAVIPVIVCYIFTLILAPASAFFGVDFALFSQQDGPYYALVSLIVNIVCVFVIYGAARLLRYLLAPIHENSELRYFFAVPTSQILLIGLFMNLTAHQIESGGIFTGAVLCLLLGMLLCVGSDILCIYGYRKFRRIQLADLKFEEAKKQLDIQANYYRNLQNDILAVNQIRHDLNNQLGAAYYLLEQGHPEEVRQQLDRLHDSIRQKVGSRFCENLMVDAVLTEKEQLCREKGIRLNVTALVPRELSIENTYLCSAFSNLLDNSIHGVLKSKSPSGPIELTSDVQGEYLVIRCKNPAAKPEKQKKQDLLREHGLGLQILRQIAELGGGNLDTQYADGEFTSVLVLKK